MPNMSDVITNEDIDKVEFQIHPIEFCCKKICSLNFF